MACFTVSFSCYATENIEQKKSHVNIYVYHLKPPFIVSNKNKLGLYYDFSDYLNNKTDKYHFETIFVPRKRIETMLEKETFNGIVLGVSPIWFKDKNEEKFLWTSSVYQDQDEFVSLAETSVDYENASSFEDKVLGGVRGFYYFGIDELVRQGIINRHNTIGEYELLQMLVLKRVDVAIVSRSTLNYLIRIKDWKDTFYTSKQPHDKYQRRVLVPHHKKAVYDDISSIIDKLSEDSAWQQILEKY
jgi:polar amino acid transport system substrate-binding protein